MGIQSLELEPNEVNILNTLTSDILGRNSSVWQFVTLCAKQERKCSIAIDAKWGAGKTFFVKQAKMLLDAYNPHTHALETEIKEEVKSIFANNNRTKQDSSDLPPIVCVYYDSWSNDNDIDPMLSIVYEIISNAAIDYDWGTDTNALNFGAALLDAISGRAISNALEELKGNDLLKTIKEQKNIHQMISNFFSSLLCEQGNHLVVFVDEMDRCKPSFAVKLLERVKHYFCDDRITFVFSVNLSELQHSVKRYYGEDFNASRYLNRFFDYIIPLPAANMDQYYRQIGLDNSFVFESVCKEVIKRNHFEIRDIIKYSQMTRIAASKPAHNQHFGFYDGNHLGFILTIIVPVVIGLKLSGSDEYDRFINGNDSSPLIDILASGDLACGYCSLLLNKGESYSDNPPDSMIHVDLEEKLKMVYEYIFNAKHNSNQEYIVGEIRFTSRTKSIILEAASMLSEFATYE